MSKERDSLFELEWRGYRMYLPLDNNSRILWGGTMLLLLAAAWIFFRDAFSIASIFALGAIVSALLASYIGFAQSLTLWENGFREWWLTLPVPRTKLIQAKMRAAIRMQAYVSSALWLVCVAYAFLRASSQNEAGETLSYSHVIQDSFAFGCLYAVLVPLFVALGFSLLGMYYGWRRVLLIPLFLIVVMPYSVFMIVLDRQVGDSKYLTAEWILLYAGIGIVLASLLYRGVLWQVSRYGIRDLGRFRPGGQSGKAEKKGDQQQATRLRGPVQGGLRGLYALESARFRAIASHQVLRVIYGCVLFLCGVGGYFAAGDLQAPFYLLKILFILWFLAPTIVHTTLIQYDTNKKRLEWWLALPYTRKQLLLIRLVAGWVSLLKVMGGLLLAIAIGIAIHGNGIFIQQFDLAKQGQILLFMILSYLGGGSLLMFIMAGQVYSYRNPVAGWLFVPLMGGLYFLPMMLNNWVVTDQLLKTGISSMQWIGLAVAAVIALPLAILFFRLGAKWLHLYALNTRDAQLKKKGERNFVKF